jgi:hypothetical protein
MEIMIGILIVLTAVNAIPDQVLHPRDRLLAYHSGFKILQIDLNLAGKIINVDDLLQQNMQHIHRWTRG